YLEDCDHFQFVVLMTYDCIAHNDLIRKDFLRMPMPNMDQNIAAQAPPFFFVLQHDSKAAKAEREAIKLYHNLRENVYWLQKENVTVSESLEYPYLQLYCRKALLSDPICDHLDSVRRGYPDALYNYLDCRVGSEYAEAENLFARGLVNRKHWAKLFCPGEVLVTFESGQPVAYICEAFPEQLEGALQVRCWTWEFDGKFFRMTTDLYIHWPSETEVAAVIDLRADLLSVSPVSCQSKNSAKLAVGATTTDLIDCQEILES
ncbi:hypothetical protein EK21DRAFT_54239, partial [Setomelanomma holmii]